MQDIIVGSIVLVHKLICSQLKVSDMPWSGTSEGKLYSHVGAQGYTPSAPLTDANHFFCWYTSTSDCVNCALFNHLHCYLSTLCENL